MRARVLAGLIAALALAGIAAPAWAAPTTQVVHGRVIRLVSVADWDAASSLSSGRAVRWDVTVSADAPDPGRIVLGVSATGDARLEVDVALCAQEWEDDGCPRGEKALRTAWEVPRDGLQTELTSMADTDVAYVRMSVALAAGEHSGSTSIRFHARGEGDSASVGPRGGLATTGMSPVVPWILAGGAILVVAGAALAVGRARGRRERSGDRGGEGP
ncbi:hypothetical protein [Microbacterium sp. XT11]|uniref:hypothetical protein n=1 Tax=Microbacterium sp. XT11 TaxID=367477 RepID=UPI000742E534|nr:hypothetical protein [Microbacterium sp. XT11]ALX65556.1 hypothetical protein AB663_000090 [Microbacterium sp. XT11]